MLHAPGAAFGVRNCAWPEVQAIVHRHAASFQKVSSVAEGLVLLRAAALQRRRTDVLAHLDREEAEAERAAHLARAARLSAEFKAKKALETQRAEVAAVTERAALEQAQGPEQAARTAAEAAANYARLNREKLEASQRAVNERRLLAARQQRAAAASRTIAAAAAKLSRADSLPRSSPATDEGVLEPKAGPAPSAGPEPFASLFVASAALQGAGIASCVILFTSTRILWVNVCMFTHGTHAKAQLRALFSGLTEASNRELSSIDVHVEHPTVGRIILGEIKPEPKLRRLLNHLYTVNSISYRIVLQPPSRPVIELAHNLLANANVPAKLTGLKRLRSL